MRFAPLLILALLAGFGICGGPAAPPPQAPLPSPSASPSPTYSLRAPAAAILGDTDVGLPRRNGGDHLTGPQVAHDQPDEVAALQAYFGFGWDEASTRTWAGDGKDLSILVLLSIRSGGAVQAYSFWRAAAARAPLVAGECPAPAAAALESCTFGFGSGRAMLVGRLGSEVFFASGSEAEVSRMAPLQAARLRAGSA